MTEQFNFDCFHEKIKKIKNPYLGKLTTEE
jgi:hypothetical protein